MKRPFLLLLSAVIGGHAMLSGLDALLTQPTRSKLGEFTNISLIAAAHAEEAAPVKYTCPMHPQILSDTPGKCPICGMDLVALPGSEHPPALHAPAMKGDTPTATIADPSGRTVLYWYDPMVPDKRFDKPGKSPFMDMDLQPKYADDTGATSSANEKPIIRVSADTLQKMGVRTEPVSTSSFGQPVRATALVTPNERTRVNLFSQVEGRIEALHPRAEGDPVTKGDLLYALVSPELIALQNDYLAASAAGLKDMARAAVKRLKLLGVDDKVIATLAKTRRASDSVPFYAPSDGILGKINLRTGTYLKMGDEIGQIQNLSTIWLEAAVPEQDLAAIKPEQGAQVSFAGDPQPTNATVDYVYPTIDPLSRTGRVRLIVDNKDGRLKPAGYAAVEFATAATERLTVPSAAVLRSSTGSHVIVSLGDGKFQARDIATGAVAGGKTEIRSGLAEGEAVVTSALFLLDSESSLRETLQNMRAPAAEAKHGQ